VKRADLGVARVAQCIDTISHVVISSGSMAEMEDQLTFLLNIKLVNDWVRGVREDRPMRRASELIPL